MGMRNGEWSYLSRNGTAFELEYHPVEFELWRKKNCARSDQRFFTDLVGMKNASLSMAAVKDGTCERCEQGVQPFEIVLPQNLSMAVYNLH